MIWYNHPNFQPNLLHQTKKNYVFREFYPTIGTTLKAPREKTSNPMPGIQAVGQGFHLLAKLGCQPVDLQVGGFSPPIWKEVYQPDGVMKQP